MNSWNAFIYLVALIALLITGCGSDGSSGDIVDRHNPPDFVGRYEATGNWDLGGPFANGRTVGDAAAELLVEQVIDLVGVPSLLKDKASEVLYGLIAADVKTAIDEQAPPLLQPDSALMQALAASLAKVEVVSAIEIQKGLLPGSVSGEETIVSVSFDIDETTYTLTSADLFPEQVASIAADWSGKVASSSTLDIDEHEFSLRYGELVKQIASLLIEAAELEALAAQAANTVDCSNVVALILDGKTDFGFEVESVGFTLGQADLLDGCGIAKAGLKDWGFSVNSKVEVGGAVQLIDEDGDDSAEEIRSAEGYGGSLLIAPGPIAPRIGVSFVGQRSE